MFLTTGATYPIVSGVPAVFQVKVSPPERSLEVLPHRRDFFRKELKWNKP